MHAPDNRPSVRSSHAAGGAREPPCRCRIDDADRRRLPAVTDSRNEPATGNLPTGVSTSIGRNWNGVDGLLIELLSEDRVLVAPPVVDKWDLIDRLAAAAAAALAVHGVDLALVREAARSRERDLSTGLEDGVALPHAFLSGDFPACAALGVLKDGLEFGCTDERPATVVLFLVAPDTTESRRAHLRRLGEAVRLLSDGDRRLRLAAAANAAAVLAALRS